MKLHDNVSPFSFSDFMLLKIADALVTVKLHMAIKLVCSESI